MANYRYISSRRAKNDDGTVREIHTHSLIPKGKYIPGGPNANTADAKRIAEVLRHG